MKLKGKNILVTGGTGFVGSHLVPALVKQQCRVIVPYRTLDPFSYFASERLEQKTILTLCDIRDEARVFDVVTRYEIDYICHLAAQSIVPTAYQNPLEALGSNIIGTANIVDAARRSPGVKGVIIASSDKAYGKIKEPPTSTRVLGASVKQHNLSSRIVHTLRDGAAKRMPPRGSNLQYHENDPLAGDHPYEVSKSAADLIAQTYWKTYRVPVAITRFGNIYGPGDLNFNRIIPGIMKSLLTKEKLLVRSDGTFVRDYVYVDDVVWGYLFLLEHLDEVKGQAFNLSSNDSYSVMKLIHASQKILRKKVTYEIQNTQVNEIPYQHLSYEKIKKLGWKPHISLRRGLTLTYRWYKKNRRKLFS